MCVCYYSRLCARPDSAYNHDNDYVLRPEHYAHSLNSVLFWGDFACIFGLPLCQKPLFPKCQGSIPDKYR